MKKVTAFLFLFIIGLLGLMALELSGVMPVWLQEKRVWILCTVAGGLGGCLYCLRGVYLNACVRKEWDPDWQPWYYIRPIASTICGGVSCLVLKAGLLLLEAGEKSSASQFGFYAFAFIAGLNVDKFISKVEDLAQATWGVEKSRAAKGNPSEK